MAVTTKTPLGASTLVRKWYLDVNTGTIGSPVWVPVLGMVNFAPNLDPTLQDDSDFDGGGYKSSTVTALAWSASGTVSRKTQSNAPTVYDPGQEFLRTTSLLQGVSNSANVRFYEFAAGGPTTEAYAGQAAVSWSPKGGAMDALDQADFTLTGQGPRSAITHPAGNVTPVISSLVPNTAGVAGGAQIQIRGSFFTGATAVTINAVPLASTNWAIVNDGLIIATASAQTAGAKTVTVTTPGGTSTAATLTYS
jgi:hypothetical protein